MSPLERNVVDRALPEVAIADQLTLVPDDGVMAIDADTGTLSINGHINTRVRREFFDALRRAPLKIVYIDSGGGDYGEAFEIAREIRRRKLHLVVKRCASACADPIFVFANSKEVVAGGYVAIHGSPAAKTVSELNESTASVGLAVNPELRAQQVSIGRDGLRSLVKKWQGLYAEIGFDTGLQRTYIEFAARQRKFIDSHAGLASEDPHCPTAHVLWAPTPDSWERNGMAGVTRYWYPDKKYRGVLIAPEEKQLSGKVWLFFSTAKQLDSLCAN